MYDSYTPVRPQQPLRVRMISWKIIEMNRSRVQRTHIVDPYNNVTYQKKKITIIIKYINRPIYTTGGVSVAALGETSFPCTDARKPQERIKKLQLRESRPLERIVVLYYVLSPPTQFPIENTSSNRNQ